MRVHQKTTHSALLLAAICLRCEAAPEAVTNTIPRDLADPAIVWGAETNGFCAGLAWSQGQRKGSPIQTVRVLLLTARTNAEWKYVTPPGRKFARFDIVDVKGIRLQPMPRRGLSAETPDRMMASDLPRTRETPRSGSLLEGRLLPPRGVPTNFRQDVVIQDHYKIAAESDCTLTVCVAIYEFSPDRQWVSRLDLPCVTTKIHLTASP